MPLAPPFTRENAAENARKATIARELNRAKKKAAQTATKDFNAQARTEKQIERVLNWLDQLGDSKKDKAEFITLSYALDRLWDKVYSKQASVKPSRSKREPMPTPIESPVVPAPVQTPQEQKPIEG